MAAKIEVARFDGKGDFGLWRRRMHAILVQQKVARALGGEKDLPDSLKDDQKQEILDIAFSTLTLHLDEKVLREVSSEKTAAGIWAKLEQLYMTKSLQDRIYLKGKLFGFRMPESQSISQSLDDFNRLVLDLENIGIEINDEDKAIIVLNSLPKSFTTFVDTMKYARESLSFSDVQSALKSKETEGLNEMVSKDIGDSLVTMDRSEKSKCDACGKNKGKSKLKNKDNKCFYCHKEGHYKRQCPERKKDFERSSGQAAVGAEVEESDFAEALCVIKDYG